MLFHRKLTVVATLAHGRIGAVHGVRLEYDVEPPVIVIVAKGKSELFYAMLHG